MICLLSVINLKCLLKIFYLQFIAYCDGFMMAALVPNIVSMPSSLDCSYSFYYFCLLMSK